MDGIFTCKINVGARTRTEILELISNVDSLISLLMTTAITSVTNGSIMEYEVDTGQTTQKVKYSTMKEVTDAIEHYEKIRQMYQNKLTPRVKRCMDSKNFRYGN